MQLKQKRKKREPKTEKDKKGIDKESQREERSQKDEKTINQKRTG